MISFEFDDHNEVAIGPHLKEITKFSTLGLHLEMAIEKMIIVRKTPPHIAHVSLFIYSFIYFIYYSLSSRAKVLFLQILFKMIFKIPIFQIILFPF